MKIDLSEFEEEYPAECAFIELMNECRAYKEQEEILYEKRI